MSKGPTFDNAALLFGVLYSAYLSLSGCCAAVVSSFGRLLSSVENMPVSGVLRFEQGIGSAKYPVSYGTAGGFTGEICFVEKVIL